MKAELIPRFQELYGQYKLSPFYKERSDQFAIVPVLKEIIKETLANNPFTNLHLTGLIQMLKNNCSTDSFNQYLVQNIPNTERATELSEQMKQINQKGYTNAGKAVINKLSDIQLNVVKTFLLDAFRILSLENSVKLCAEFDAMMIPEVTKGIYSPWLYYINPQVFPIINNSHEKFREWIEIPSAYPSCIRDFNELKTLVNENELGVLDMFAHKFTSGDDFWDVDYFIGNLHKKFRNIWRCATSGYWNEFRDKNILSVNWLEGNTDYSILKDFGDGKMVKKRWVNGLKQGDLIVVLDKYKYYGVGIAKTAYAFKQNDVDLRGKLWPCIEIEFLHELKTPVNHEMTITHTNPATFFELNGVSFSEKDTFKFLRKSFPEAINKLDEYMGVETPEITQNKANLPHTNNLKDILMNSILYGPPGTGKTFHSITHSVAIVENKSIETILSENRELVKGRFDEYIESGQIVFCTFHQSLGYEDFIEGIKPIEPSSEDEQISYAVEDGIFKQICTEAAFSFVQQNSTAETEKVLDFSAEFDRYVDSINEKLSQNKPIEILTKSGGKVFIDSINNNNNILVKYKTTVKPITVSKKRLSQISKAFPNLNTVSNINLEFRAVIGGCDSTVYWAVLNDIRNKFSGESSDSTIEKSTIEYSYEDKKEILETLEKEDFLIENPKRFVLILDEINRGNVSQIFGELITLIEDDKRLGKEESLKSKLPYSKEQFGVPCNLHIIGTMNTADRSVEALDTALRRRFSFIHMQPKPNELKITDDGINLPSILSVLNERLSILKDCDHTIGHAWLWNIKNLENLKSVFGNKILPLLQEYFYNDYEKLGLVLGDQFFKPHIQVSSSVFATFSGGNGLAGQYDQSYQYELKSISELLISDFKSLESQDNQVNPDEE